MDFTNGKTLLELCQKDKLAISEEMLLRETEISGKSRAEITERMAYSYSVMKDAARRAIGGGIRSMGGLIGGESHLLSEYGNKGRTVSGSITARAAAYAIGVLEVNASMGLIVAAPTAGSSGVIPGTFLAVQEEYGSDMPTNRDVQYDKYGYLGTPFLLVGSAVLDDYYNWYYDGMDSIYFCMSVTPEGGSYSDEWYIYASRSHYEELFDDLKEGGISGIVMICRTSSPDTGSNNMAELADYFII